MGLTNMWEWGVCIYGTYGVSNNYPFVSTSVVSPVFPLPHSSSLISFVYIISKNKEKKKKVLKHSISSFGILPM